MQVLIVDDDSFFLSMFTNLIDWSSYGCRIAGTAENGQKAIELLETRHIDLLFTDMSMPLLDGLGLIRYVTQHHPTIKYVVLSSYDDFQYVKDSLKSGAIDYILKHMLTKQSLEALLTRLTEKTGKKPNSALPKDDAMFSLMQSDFLSDLLSGRSIPTASSAFTALSLPVLQNNLLLFMLNISNFDLCKQKYIELNKFKHWQQSILSVMQSILDHLDNGIVFYNYEDELIFTLASSSGFSNPSYAHQTIELYSRQVHNSLKRYFNIEGTIYASRVCSGLQELPEVYEQLLTQHDLQKIVALPSQTMPVINAPEPVSDAEHYSSYVYGALNIIHKRYNSSELCLGSIANELYVNASYLCKVFKRECGVGLPDYLNQYRITIIKDLLLTSTLSVKQIAYSCGFENYNYFFRIFKKYLGLTPLEFRSQVYGKNIGL